MLPLPRTPVNPPRVPARTRAVSVSGRSLPLEIREHPRATRITLRIEPGGRSLRLTVPRGLPIAEIDAFMSRHEGWLKAKLIGYPESAGLGAGSVIALRGVEHRVVLSGGLRGLTRATTIDGEPVITVAGGPQHVGRRLADFLKKEARIDLEEAVARHAAVAGRKVRALKLKDTKSRWGSCSADGTLSFSWRIVMAPPHVIDYLAAHEAAHLVEMNHGPRFWALCRKLCPATEQAKAWLKKNGNRLQVVDFS